MATPDPKRQKISRSPLIFKSRLGHPDVRFKIFGEYEIHAHSWVLKDHSQFFLKFLDPSNKDGSSVVATASASLSRVQVDKSADLSMNGFRRSRMELRIATLRRMRSGMWYQLQVSVAFENLIGAFYQRPFVIESHTDLDRLTKMADYYCALRLVSLNLNQTFMDVPWNEAVFMLKSAAKLRNPILFRDCVTLACGPWPLPSFKDEETPLRPEILRALHRAFDSIGALVAEVEWDLTTEVFPRPNESKKRAGILSDRRKDMRKTMENLKAECMNASGYDVPKYFLALSNSEFGPRFQHLFDQSLDNNMTLNRNAVAGKGKFERHFLFERLADEDLPWDTTETDW